MGGTLLAVDKRHVKAVTPDRCVDFDGDAFAGAVVDLWMPIVN